MSYRKMAKFAAVACLAMIAGPAALAETSYPTQQMEAYQSQLDEIIQDVTEIEVQVHTVAQNIVLAQRRFEATGSMAAQARLNELWAEYERLGRQFTSLQAEAQTIRTKMAELAKNSSKPSVSGNG